MVVWVVQLNGTIKRLPICFTHTVCQLPAAFATARGLQQDPRAAAAEPVAGPVGGLADVVLLGEPEQRPRRRGRCAAARRRRPVRPRSAAPSAPPSARTRGGRRSSRRSRAGGSHRPAPRTARSAARCRARRRRRHPARRASGASQARYGAYGAMAHSSASFHGSPTTTLRR